MLRNKMNISYLISLSLCTICVSCIVQTSEQDFKKKYDWDVCIATFISFGYKGICNFQYEYNGTHYEEIEGRFAYYESIAPGYKYPILIDKNNPGKNYKVLFDQPILQDTTIVYQTVGKIRGISQIRGMVQIQYNFQIGSKHCKRDEYLPIEYLEICKKRKKEKEYILINLYSFQDYRLMNNETVYISFIDRGSLQDIPRSDEAIK